MTTPVSAMLIKGLKFEVCLGWPEKERLQKQTVLVDIDLQFAVPPAACESDQLADTFCYSDLIIKIQKEIGEKNYRLIEHLSYDIYRMIKPMLSDKSKVIVRILKYPHIDGLTGGVQFSYGDDL